MKRKFVLYESLKGKLMVPGITRQRTYNFLILNGKITVYSHDLRSKYSSWFSKFLSHVSNTRLLCATTLDKRKRKLWVFNPRQRSLNCLMECLTQTYPAQGKRVGHSHEVYLIHHHPSIRVSVQNTSLRIITVSQLRISSQSLT